jgi:hypothetical protein
VAYERLGERLRHRLRRLGGLAGLALVALLLITACDESEPVDPGQLPGGSDNSGSTGGDGSDSTSIGDEALVGTWVNVTVPQNDQDVTRVTTTWLFRADGICGRSIVTESASSGTSPTLRVGTCRAASNQITVLFTEEASAFTMVYGFPNLATLTLDGLQYELIASE